MVNFMHSAHLLFENVHWCLMGFELLVLEEDPSSQLHWRWKVRVIAEVTFKEEARHKTFSDHRLKTQHIIVTFCPVIAQLHSRGKRIGKARHSGTGEEL